jgi:HD-GYP domain-containing protein (c-di-GMP phosphodiesterase class II)
MPGSGNPAAQGRNPVIMDANERADICSNLLDIMEELYHIKDLDALLDTILLQARKLTQADAGSIYLIENNALQFSFCHNDTLSRSARTKYAYTSQTLPIDNQSISGYVALTGRPVMLDDVYEIPWNLPFTFNHFFDDVSGYRTKSLLALPLKTSRDKVVGVLEIINAEDGGGALVPFTDQDRQVLNHFANHAAVAVERALLTREVILRMIKMCELRDPEETGAHANRVGAYSAEIYHQWASKKGISEGEIKKTRDLIRIAAMLHDLGKIAISDLILKKPSHLDADEFTIMQRHTIYGARLFENPDSELDVICAEIALNHHEHWDGSGYPGKIATLDGGPLETGPGKKGEEIPLAARIVSLADVYDALVSKRSYKDSFSEDRALELIREQSGKQFDPEVVAAFFSIYDVIAAIKERYQEDASFNFSCRIAP